MLVPDGDPDLLVDLVPAPFASELKQHLRDERAIDPARIRVAVRRVLVGLID